MKMMVSKRQVECITLLHLPASVAYNIHIHVRRARIRVCAVRRAPASVVHHGRGCSLPREPP